MLTATGLTLLNGSSAELNSCRHRQPSLPDVSTEPQPFHAIPGDTGTQRHTDKQRYTETDRTDRQTDRQIRIHGSRPLPLVCLSTEPQPFHAIPGDTGTQRHTDKHRYTERERQTDRQTEENTRKQPLPLVCLSQGSKKPGFWGFFLKKPNPVGL